MTVTISLRQALRDQIIALAENVLDGELVEVTAVHELAEHCPDLSESVRAVRLGDLLAELEHQRHVADRSIELPRGWSWPVFEEDAQERVDGVADRLIGGI